MKEKKAGLRSPTMPKEHFEHKAEDIPVCGEKYATEFGNPSDLQRAAAGLANYVKKNVMKY
jgi:hypothetical protein